MTAHTHTQQPLPIPLHNSLFRSSELRSTHPQSQSIPILQLLDLVHASKYHPTTMGFPKKTEERKNTHKLVGGFNHLEKVLVSGKDSPIYYKKKHV